MFETYEIGSLPKPLWIVKALRREQLSEEDFRKMREWSRIVGVEEEEKELEKKLRANEASRKKIRDFAALFNIRYLESAGLDYVYDGEARRIEMYEYPVKYIEGIEILDWVRSFDNKYYRKGVCVDRPKLKKPYHVDEFIFVKEHARRGVKIPITGPYTLADWSFNEYYYHPDFFDIKRSKYRAKEEFVFDLAREIIRPNIIALVNAGAKWIQIDEPAATTHPEEVPLFVEAFNEVVKGIDCKFSVHICYSDYSLLYPHILDMKVDHYAFEYANSGNYNGTLSLFKEYGDKREIGLGVIDVHRDNIESPELVKERLLYGYRFLEDYIIYANPDCGLRTRSLEIAYQKLKNLVKGAQMAREEI